MVLPHLSSPFPALPLCAPAMGSIVPPHAAQLKCVEVLIPIPQNVAEFGDRNL